ncbi:MAG: PEP-CTERM sorting domain-containing protein [Fimbriimonadaceae bacterium]|nr:PEP-CTERM sorting domain-containing protein [Fimbriimonadaceae bacterium]
MRGITFAVLALASVSAFGQNVLVWSTGNAGGDTPGVAAWLQGSGQFTSVTGVNDDFGMTQGFLDSFDRVLFFTNSGGDPVNNGNLLGNFAMSGKRLVIACFALADQGSNTIGGSIVGMMPLNFDGGSKYSNVSMASNDGGPFFAGVNSVDGYYHDDVALVRGTSHGLWSDGEIMVASNGEILNVNLFPDDSFGQVSGDYRQLFVNSLKAPVPEPTTMAFLGLGLAALARRRFRKA